MTSTIKKCEDNIKQLNFMQCSNAKEEMIKNNMKLNLAEKIRDFTKAFRNNEEKYVRNFQELVGEDFNISNSDFDSSKESSDNFLEVYEDNTLKQRNEEISALLNSINDLATTFKDLQLIVHEQGTILDRIDYNIDTALDDTKLGKKHLEKANENLKQNCFRNSTFFIMLINFSLAVMILFKFT